MVPVAELHAPAPPRRARKHEREERELVEAFQTAYAKATRNPAFKLGPTARKRLIAYFRASVVPQLDDELVGWDGAVQKFVLFCMKDLARSVARENSGNARLTKVLLDRHTLERRPRWEDLCPLPPAERPEVAEEEGAPDDGPVLGWACVNLAAFFKKEAARTRTG